MGSTMKIAILAVVVLVALTAVVHADPVPTTNDGNSILCEACTLAITYAEKLPNSTDDKLIDVLYKICDELPSTAEKIACNITVKTEGKHIISEIESGVAPS